MDKEVNYMRYCYRFLECDVNSSESELRDSFLYKLREAYREMDSCKHFHNLYFDEKMEDDENYRYYEEKSRRDEFDLIKIDLDILYDSYLSILLSKKDSSSYENIIHCLSKRWKYDSSMFVDANGNTNRYVPLRFPREAEKIEMAEPRYMSKREYVDLLNDLCRPLKYPEIGFDSKLSLIASLEEEMMDENQVVKLCEKRFAPLGRIEKKNEQKIKQKKVNDYPNRMK